MALFERHDARPRETRKYVFSGKAFVLGIFAAIWIWTADAYFESIIKARNQIKDLRDPVSRVITIGIATERSLTEFTPGMHDFRQCPDLEDGRLCSYIPAHNSSCEECDALLFRGFHLDPNVTLPRRHPAYQKWIFFETESPQRTWSHLKNAKSIWNEFNFTVTYAPDADVQYSRFHTLQCKRVPQQTVADTDYASTKQKNATALWLVSNCNDTSGRELYVNELRKYLPVDVYGGCGLPLPCQQFRREFKLRGGCVRRLMSRYKFYLSFESSFCDGYLTEKIWKTFRVNVIPVVMGNADYRGLLSPDTFIDVRDFGSPRDLADYLHYLDENDDAYNAIIHNRKSVKCLKVFPGPPHCLMCQHLHEFREKREVLADVADFWSPSRRCSTPGEFFKGIAEDVLKENPQLRGRYV